jgi:hypothetical protein
MTQIPMIAWFNEGYKKTYPKKYHNLLNRTELLYSNDMLYDTMIGIFGIKTDRYNSKFDFSSDSYELKDKDALVLHGKRKYTDKSNIIYWQKINTKYLIDTNQSSRIFPHRIDSIGKLKDIWNDGFRSFEVDVRFGDNNTTTFQMGHNHGVMGVGLEEFLNSIDYNKIKRVWLDFKNLNYKNHESALQELEKLDKKYNIKKKLIVESGTTGEFFKLFNVKGWHTSYYLPTGRIINLLKKNDTKEMQNLSLKIAKQTETQHLSAVSFDYRLYPFVKQYLEPKISDKIVYHMWLAPALGDVDFVEKLKKNKLYLDNRVKTLLSTYKSQFNL